MVEVHRHVIKTRIYTGNKLVQNCLSLSEHCSYCTENSTHGSKDKQLGVLARTMCRALVCPGHHEQETNANEYSV